MKPQAPTTFLDMPFCQNGDKTIPRTSPDETTEGRFTVEQGFPEETQLPVTRGGIAPNRWDFNGAYYILSAFAFWQQSGGLMTWNSSLSYVPPALVYYNGIFYVCVGENGPETDMGEAVRPTEDTDGTYWQSLFTFLSNNENLHLVGQGNTVSLTGDTTGNGTFDSDGNVSIATTTAKATQLRTGRGLTLTGDTTGTLDKSFDGTSDVSIATTTTTATQLRTARTFSISGDVTASAVSFNGTGNVELKATIDSSLSSAAFSRWKTISSRTFAKTYTASEDGYVLICAEADYGTRGWTVTVGSYTHVMRQGEYYGSHTDTCVFPVRSGVSYSAGLSGEWYGISQYYWVTI